MLPNTPKHHFGSNGGYWVCSRENVRWKFGTPKQCISVPKRTSFSHCFACIQVAKCYKTSNMLQNSPKYHFGSNGGYWVCSCEHIRRNFSTPKRCITVLKLTSFSFF